MIGLFHKLGSIILDIFNALGEHCILFIKSIQFIFTRPYNFRLILKQMEEIGVNSSPVILVTALFTGMVLAVQSFYGVRQFGAQQMVGSIVALSMTRELGPVLSALMLAGRSGSSMAAELGTMAVTEQIDALRTLATNPVKYLVTPRLVAAVIMLPLLVLIGDAIGLLGGFIVGIFVLHLNSTTYMDSTFAFLIGNDVISGLIKAAFFAAAIAIISCYQGMKTSGGAEGVGKATTAAVVFSCMAVLISDYFLTVWLFPE